VDVTKPRNRETAKRDEALSASDERQQEPHRSHKHRAEPKATRGRR
jgi:hypothetical protein